MTYAMAVGRAMILDTRHQAYRNYDEHFEPVLGPLFLVSDNATSEELGPDGCNNCLHDVTFDAATQQYHDKVDDCERLFISSFYTANFEVIRSPFHQAYKEQFPQLARQILRRRVVAQGLWELK